MLEMVDAAVAIGVAPGETVSPPGARRAAPAGLLPERLPAGLAGKAAPGSALGKVRPVEIPTVHRPRLSSGVGQDRMLHKVPIARDIFGAARRPFRNGRPSLPP